MDRNADYLRIAKPWPLSLSARRAWIEIHSRIPISSTCAKVALRKESVDRNGVVSRDCVDALVALRKESVDRNHDERIRPRSLRWSLSARRAWIEMSAVWDNLTDQEVALRKESVDRNGMDAISAHRQSVALRKESVDRNALAAVLGSIMLGRSPQGERG